MKDSQAYWPYYWQPFYMVKSLPLALPTTSAAAQQTDSTTTSAATQQTDSTTPSTVKSTSSEAATVKIKENGTSIVGEIRATTGPYYRSLLDILTKTSTTTTTTTTTKRPRRTTTTRKPRPSISATEPIDCSSDIEFWPHPECDKYIWCIDGEQLTQQCSKGLFWNYQLEKCDWPATVPTDHCTNPPPVVNSLVTTTPVPPRDCSTDIEFYSHPDCDKFIRCTDGEPQTFICPGNLYWDNDNEQCEWPKKVPTSDCIVPTKKSL